MCLFYNSTLLNFTIRPLKKNYLTFSWSLIIIYKDNFASKIVTSFSSFSYLIALVKISRSIFFKWEEKAFPFYCFVFFFPTKNDHVSSWFQLYI